MSGFEVVGVVLGAIPLAIEGIKLYGSGISSIRAIIYYDRIFDDLESRLRGAATVLRQTCEELLLGLGIPDDELRDLLETQKGWDSDSLKEKLMGQMGTSDYNDFEAIAIGLRRRLDELGTKLGLDSQWKAPFLVDGKVDKVKRREFFHGPWKRIKRGLKADEHEQIIIAIRDDAVNIHVIVQSSLRLRVPRQEQTQKQRRGQTIPWKTAREHSLRLHKVLDSNWESLCKSHLHSVWIRFKPPAKKGVGYEPYDLLSCSFALGCTSSTPSSPPLNWRSVAVLPCYSQTTTPAPAPRPSATPTIAIHHLNTSQHPGSCCSAKICNLCQALCLPSNGVACLGYLDNERWTYHFREDVSDASRHWAGKRSLRQKISDTSQRYVPTTREKRLISLLLATVVLQLHGTSWLSKSWTLDDIFTLANDEICVVYTFDQTPRHLTGGVVQNNGADILRNQTLFSLGEALLELTYQEPLHNAAADTFTRYREAITTAKRLQNNELESFASTVAKCLNPSSPTFLDYDLEQEAFLNWYYQEIVVPLKKDYDIFIS